jgi:hypothetical protein
MDFDNEAETDVEEPPTDPALPRHLAYAMACSSSRERAGETGAAETGVGHR